VTLQIVVLRGETPCIFIGSYQHFVETCCFQLQAKLNFPELFTSVDTVLQCGRFQHFTLKLNFLESFSYWRKSYNSFSYVSETWTAVLANIRNYSHKYCGIFDQRRKCGARETAVARERVCKHVRSVDVTWSLQETCTHQWKGGWKRCFPCRLCQGYITRCSCHCERLEAAVRRVWGWCEMVASL
jgi:hypothetical protein